MFLSTTQPSPATLQSNTAKNFSDPFSRIPVYKQWTTSIRKKKKHGWVFEPGRILNHPSLQQKNDDYCGCHMHVAPRMGTVSVVTKVIK